MSMSSETEILKTNEFLRRRKLRLQQVREQSKDIAKKIRQRAKVEKLRQIVDLDSKREKDYFQKQEKLVKRLEQLYAQGVRSVGDGHKKASEETHNECSPKKDAISKIRGKEAVAELRRRKQEKLDEQKKVLDRKLLAREAANEISREKSSTVANKLIAKSSSSKLTEEADANEKETPSDDVPKVTRTDMATQWDFEELPSEWEPNVPALSLPRDDKESVKDSNNAAESKSDKSKRLDLFALSAEMPSSLRGGLSNVPEDRPSIRPSLTLVSEYLQSRALRLRDTDTTGSSKKHTDDLSNIKNTILRSRSSKIEAKGSLDKSTVSSAVETNLTKKNSVTMYNHSTRDSRDIPCGDSRLVVRDLQTDEDAYSQALKEATTDHGKDKEHQKKLQEMRNKVAMTKQTVEKEYLDTMSFLKSLPKDNSSKPVKNAYMDERRQHLLKASRQQKLQQEFNKIEKECRKNCENKRAKQTTDKTPKKSKSPGRDCGDDFESRDLQYSWMPVPESDGNLAIHAIPTTLKEGKSGNTVKFSKVDSYHEYRSRHKHTPPTKDTNHNKQPNKKVVETVIIQNDNDETTYCSSISSDTSSVENMNLETKDQAPDTAMSEADRIIIYKILDKKEKERKKLKLIDNVAKVLKSLDKEKQKIVNDNNNNKEEKGHSRGEEEAESNPIQHVDEGVYKVVSEKGDNIASLYFTDKVKTQERRNIVITEDEQRFGRPCCCKKNSSNTQQSDKGTNLHCRADEDSGIRSGNCLGCKCGCENNPRPKAPSTKAVKPTVQPSAATSTSSFKTATTDKAHSALPDGGYIKLIDDDGHEAGKFYIGASGFLKDDAYEVIIQLRKKEQKLKADQEKETLKNLQKNNGIDNETVLSVQDLSEEDTSNRPKSNLLEEVTEKADTGRKEVVLETNTETPKVLPQTSSTHLNNTNDNEVNDFAESDKLSSGGSAVSSNEPNSERMPKLVDKGVHTSFQLSYAIPSHVPKTDNIPRPATSTYTQTTMDSPNPRPLFIHMSSSTSTAYMSPPDMVLPNFMKNDYEYQGEKLKFPDRFNHCKNKNCTRKRCKCRKTKAPASSRKSSNNNILNPPPNTARDDNDNSDIYVDEFQSAPRKKHSDKCHKCTYKSGSASNFPNKNVKNRNAPLHKISSRNLVMRISSSTASSFKNKIHSLHTNKIANKSDLNPIIKKYVNRLLELNREGIKAIEVANQECSSVSTPGSSIIEVPRNLNDKESSIGNKLSLEQMKNLLKQKILEEYVKETTNNSSVQTLCNTHKSRTGLHKLPKKRSVHRVKSLNISKRLLKTKKQSDTKSSNLRNLKTNPSTSSPSSARETITKQPGVIHNNTKPRSKSSPTPRQYPHYEKKSNKITSDTSDNIDLKTKKNNLRTKSNSSDYSNRQVKPQQSSNKTNHFSMPIHRVSTTSPDSELEALKRRQEDEAAMNISTQTSQDLDSEINLMKLAEDKLQNMEKIADLTEKCTKRLSNLAKVLEEVRRNKSLAYSQISTSDTASDTEYRSDKNVSVNNVTKRSAEPASDVQDKTDPRPSTATSTEQEEKEPSVSSDYVPFLMNIPKPAEFKYPAAQSNENVSVKSNLIANSNIDGVPVKRREKPPPALSRMHLKYGQDIIPHELSTVVEVDSPMSMKMKNKSSTNTKCELSDISYKMNNDHNGQNVVDKAVSSANSERPGNPDILLQSNTSVSKPHNKNSTDSSDDSKLQMMDLKQFNELMLKPFISIQEFAKQCGGDVGPLDDGSNLEDIPKDDGINDELSSLHSDGSLPDVIAELLKRNIITEPFKFDTMSNVNSTTVSSESMMSVLALSKARKEKKKSSVVFQNKGNGSETSDSLSISSNPDLENAFKKLGMGWASSTLKKTKERLALSSSSNTSSSSLSQFKLKSLNEQDIPALVTDSVLSATKLSSKKHQEKKAADISRNAEQQTSFMNSMTVKEFLTNELAKKITFTNKSNRNETEDEFVSLFETKMPDEMKHISLSVREERSMDSVASAQNNRARTSTPVQIFKSMAYHSSSSSNMSNGLFSNADDLSSVKVTSNSVRNHSTSDKDDLTIPNFSLKMRKGASDCSKSE